MRLTIKFPHMLLFMIRDLVMMNTWMTLDDTINSGISYVFLSFADFDVDRMFLIEFFDK
jgi:hypothetical protein